jgi:hypothetical protein
VLPKVINTDCIGHKNLKCKQSCILTSIQNTKSLKLPKKKSNRRRILLRLLANELVFEKYLSTPKIKKLLGNKIKSISRVY